MIMLKSGNFKFRTPSSEQGGRFDLPEAGERMKRKPKYTGHSYKSRFKRTWNAEDVPVESALDKSEKVMDQGVEERVHSPPSKKMRLLKKKDVQCSKEISNSGKDPVLGGKSIGKEASKADERRNVKNTIQESSASNSGNDLVLGGKGIGKEASKVDERRNVKNIVQKNSASNSGKDVLGGQGIGKEASKVDERRNVKNIVQDNSASNSGKDVVLGGKGIGKEASKVYEWRNVKNIVQENSASNSGKDLVLGGKGIGGEASKVDERRNVKNTIQENSANDVHYEDRDRIPIKQKIKVKEEDQSAGRDTNVSVDDIKKRCDTRMKKLVQKQKGQIEEFHRAWEDGFKKLVADIKLEMAFFRTIYGKSSRTTEELEILGSELAKKRAENNLQKDMKLKELEAEHLAARTEEKRKADGWLSKAPVSRRLNGCSKAQSSGSQNEEVSGVYKSRILIGGKDMMPLTQKHGENNDSDCRTTEDVARNGINEHPSFDLEVSQKNEGGTGRKTNEVGMISSDTQIPDIVEQIKQRVHCERQSLELHEDIPSELPQTVAEDNVIDANLVNTSTNIPVEGMAEFDATDLPDAENSCGDERISPNLPASGESVLAEVQSVELHGEVPEELPQTVADENVNDANLVNMSMDTPVEGMTEIEATDLPDAENSGGDERISPNLPFSGESVLDDVQSVELHGDISEELPETVANENVDGANMVDLSTSTPNEVFGEGDAIDLPDDKHFTHPKRFGIDEMLKGIPAVLAKTVAHEIVDSVNPVELSADNSIEGFGEVGVVHVHDAFLNQRNAADGTTIGDLLLDGQECKTSEQTEAFRHTGPLLPLQVQEDQDAVSAEVQVHDAGKINTSPSEVVTSELVDTAANSLSNIEPQACEEPAIETQSSSTTEVSTSKIVNTVITEESSLKAHDHEKSVLEDQVASQIEVADLEMVDTAAPIPASEVVDTAETLQSLHELQEQVEPAMETRSTTSIEATVSQNLSNAEEQVEDALTVNDVSLDIGVSNAEITGNLNPVQSHIDAPSIDSCSQLPSTDLECQNHNLESNSSEAVEPPVLWDDSVSLLIEDLLQLRNSCDVSPENLSSSATRVQTPASFQNNAAAEGVSHLQSHQAAASNPLSLISDPLQNELERIRKEAETLQKSHQEMMSGLKSECAKEIEELIAEVRRKYQLKTDDAIAQFRLKNYELDQSRKKIIMNKLLADAFRSKCLNTQSTWPLVQQGSPSGSMQYHQQLASPNPQISFVVGQPVHQTSVPQAARITPLTSRNGQPMQQAPVQHSTRLGRNTNQNSAALSVPHAMVTHVTSQGGQPMQQLNSTRLGPVTNQNFAAQSVQDAQQLAAARFRAMNSFISTSIHRFGESIQSSPNFQASTPAAASSMATFNIFPYFQNLQLQQQQQQHTLVAPQCPSNSQNFQDLGYSPSLSQYNLPSLQVLAQNHQNLGGVQGNWNSCGGATTAIYLSDDD